MKRYRFGGMGLVILLTITLTSCKCPFGQPAFGNYRDFSIVSLFKYHPGEDYSKHVWVKIVNSKRDVRVIKQPMAMDSGFYMGEGMIGRINGVSFILSFTYEDLQKGRMPDDWEQHWHDYVIAEKPFEKFYSINTDGCENYEAFPAYCQSCKCTFCIDTALMNYLIRSGELFEYYYITNEL